MRETTQVLQGKTGSLRHEKKSGARVGTVGADKRDGTSEVLRLGNSKSPSSQSGWQGTGVR